jgi:hypothetical protein
MTSPRFTPARLALLLGVPLAWGILLLFHPVNGDSPYAIASDDVTRWMTVHIGTLVFIGLMGLALFVLVQDLPGRAATVARSAILPFVVFYAAYEAIVGLASGVLVEHANGVPAAELPAAIAAIDALQDSVVVQAVAALGGAAWVVAAIAAAIAFARADAPRAVPILIALSALVAMHPPPYGPIGLACFIGGVVLLARHEHAPAVAAPPRGPTPTPTMPAGA